MKESMPTGAENIAESLSPREKLSKAGFEFLKAGSVGFVKKYIDENNLDIREIIDIVGQEKLSEIIPVFTSGWYEAEYEQILKKQLDLFGEEKEELYPALGKSFYDSLGRNKNNLGEILIKNGIPEELIHQEVVKHISDDLQSSENKISVAEELAKRWEISDEELISLKKESIPFRISNGHKEIFTELWTSEMVNNEEMIDHVKKGAFEILKKSTGTHLQEFKDSTTGSIFLRLIETQPLEENQNMPQGISFGNNNMYTTRTLSHQTIMVMKDGTEVPLESVKSSGSNNTFPGGVLMSGRSAMFAVSNQLAQFIGVPFKEITPDGMTANAPTINSSEIVN
jgi:hypothetical protein